MPQAKRTTKNRNKNNDSFLLSLIFFTLFFAAGTAFFSSRTSESQEKVLSVVAVHTTKNIVDKGIPAPLVTAKAVHAIDFETGKVLFSKQADGPLLPASTTKMVTAIVSLAHYHPDQVLTVNLPYKVNGQVMGLVNGEQITVKNLLYGTLIFSANDAAEILAQNYPGGRENFVNSMNETVKMLGAVNTHFKNPVGFDEYLHFSTVNDLVKIAVYGLQNPLFSQIVAVPQIDVTSVDGKIVHKLTSTNKLFGVVPGIIGVKTGWTENAGEALVTLVDQNGHKVVVALLGSQDRFGETKKIIEWIYSNYEWVSL